MVVSLVGPVGLIFTGFWVSFSFGFLLSFIGMLGGICFWSFSTGILCWNFGFGSLLVEMFGVGVLISVLGPIVALC